MTTTTYTVTEDDIYPTGYTIPSGYMKGEFRFPALGESYLTPKGEMVRMEKGDTRPAGPRVILKFSTPTVEEVYKGCVPVTPKGWVRGEFRVLQEGESWLGAFGGRCAPADDEPNFWRYVLTPAPPKPTQPAIAPEGYYFTGEFIVPKKGQTYFYYGKAQTTSWNYDQFWILAPIPPAPVIEGWEAVEYRVPTTGDHYEFGGAELEACGPHTLRSWILKETPKPPTTLSIYGTSTPEIPEGYESTGVVRLATKGDWCLAAGETTPRAWQESSDFSGADWRNGDMDYARLILRPVPPTPKPRRWVVEVEEGPAVKDDGGDFTNNGYKGAAIGIWRYRLSAPNTGEQELGVTRIHITSVKALLQ